jgi:hypothetical protein
VTPKALQRTCVRRLRVHRRRRTDVASKPGWDSCETRDTPHLRPDRAPRARASGTQERSSVPPGTSVRCWNCLRES